MECARPIALAKTWASVGGLRRKKSMGRVFVLSVVLVVWLGSSARGGPPSRGRIGLPLTLPVRRPMRFAVLAASRGACPAPASHASVVESRSGRALLERVGLSVRLLYGFAEGNDCFEVVRAQIALALGDVGDLKLGQRVVADGAGLGGESHGLKSLVAGPRLVRGDGSIFGRLARKVNPSTGILGRSTRKPYRGPALGPNIPVMSKKTTMGRPRNNPGQAFNGDALAVRRLSRGLSVEAAAASIGVGASTWSRWERGESKPNADQLKAICRLLRVRASTLASPPKKAERTLLSYARRNRAGA